MFEDSDEKIVEKIIQLVELDDRLVLEVGCGDGRVTTLLAAESTHLFAIEPDEDLIRKALARIAGVFFIRASGEDLPFPDKYFDIILFTLSLHHQESRRALGEAERVLKDNGAVLVVEPAENGEVERFFTLLHDETMAKRQAQIAVQESNLTVDRSDLFFAQWIFENDDDLSKSLFDYYGLTFDHDTAQQIYKILGKKRDTHPIVLTDTMMIQALTK